MSADLVEPVEIPSLPEEEAPPILTEEEIKSERVTLADICAKATAYYAQKNYDDAADLYSEAAQLQDRVNGPLNPDNAEILFLYGRALFKVGQQQSEILGEKISGDKKKEKTLPKSKKVAPKVEEKSELEKVTEEGVAIVAEQQNGGAEKPEAEKPLFQFTGDENFDYSDDEDAEVEDDGEEEQDDLQDSFRALDLARVLFEKKIEQPEEEESKGKETGLSPMARHLKERLADTHSLLGQLVMENEGFRDAVGDLRKSLEIKQELYPEEDEIIAEAHFLLSLALEFASINTDANNDEQVDQTMRDEAATELKAAIKSTRKKLDNKKVELAVSNSPDDNDITKSQIADVQQMIDEMEDRLTELSRPPIDVGGLKEAVFGSENSSNVLGKAIGESPSDAAARIEEAKRNANDLSGLVRHKPKKTEPEAEVKDANGTNGKRKAEDEPEAEVEAKKAKVEVATEES